MTDCCTYSLAISKEQLAELPKVTYPGNIKVVNTAAEMRRAISILKRYEILGFDTESRPTFRKGATIHVSLIQIATEDVCFLFRIRKITDISPLKEIIESESILKIGLSLHDDFNTTISSPKDSLIYKKLCRNIISQTQACKKYMQSCSMNV